MSDEEYKRLKDALMAEEKRREKVRKISLQIEILDKEHLGLFKRNEWTRKMVIDITQTWEQINEYGIGVPHKLQVALLNQDDVELFMEAIDILVENKKKQLEKLIKEAE